MIDPSRTPKGTLVRHKTKGYIGHFDGTTSMQNLFERPSDIVGCRVAAPVAVGGRRQIASLENLEIIEDLTIEERHKANIEFLGLEWRGVRPVRDRACR